ncbi:2888_t:CDS:1 [Ambispora gerdemannii]|uniref:2888_t:CDS:1 n=1 Tax=Ambispora gerdemannii TaxID=144530 RepID=A0A9N9CIC2_9GLOM|nr:2888_t:CDS:1 [Ambispora gerdemannii]
MDTSQIDMKISNTEEITVSDSILEEEIVASYQEIVIMFNTEKSRKTGESPVNFQERFETILSDKPEKTRENFYEFVKQRAHDLEYTIIFAFLCDRGIGTQIDNNKAFVYYKQAAEQGDAFSQYSTGLRYFLGYGVKTDRREAQFWYRKSAEAGYIHGQFQLGYFLTLGHDKKKNWPEANYWLNAAMAQGSTSALDILGICYVKGHGPQKDMRVGCWYYQRGAMLGNYSCQCEIAKYYRMGEGVPKDIHMAIKWFRKNVNSGFSKILLIDLFRMLED